MKNLFWLYAEGIKKSKINWLCLLSTFLMMIALLLNANKNFSWIYVLPLFTLIGAIAINMYIARQVRKNCYRNAAYSDKEKLTQGYLWFASYKNYFFNSEFSKIITEVVLYPSMSILLYTGIAGNINANPSDNTQLYKSALILLVILMNANTMLTFASLIHKARILGRIDENKTPNDYFNFAIENPEEEKNNFEKMVSKQALLKVNSEKSELINNNNIIADKAKKIRRL